MEVILLKDVSGFGRRGEIKSASDGYARNFLFPGGFAKPATASAIADLKNKHQQKTAKEQAKHQQYEEWAMMLMGKDVVIKSKQNKQGGLFAAVNERAIAHAMSEIIGKEVDEKTVILTAPIKELGDFTALWAPSDDIKREIRIVVEAE